MFYVIVPDHFRCIDKWASTKTALQCRNGNDGANGSRSYGSRVACASVIHKRDSLWTCATNVQGELLLFVSRMPEKYANL
jgi:hypothetical protein